MHSDFIEVDFDFVIDDICRNGLGYLSATLLEYLNCIDNHAG